MMVKVWLTSLVVIIMRYLLLFVTTCMVMQVRIALPSITQQQSYDVCLEVERRLSELFHILSP